MTTKHHQTLASWIFGTVLFLVLACVLLRRDSIPPDKQGLVAVFAATMGSFFAFFFTGSMASKFQDNPKSNTIISATGGAAIFIIIFFGLAKHLSPTAVILPSVPTLADTSTNKYPSASGSGKSTNAIAARPSPILSNEITLTTAAEVPKAANSIGSRSFQTASNDTTYILTIFQPFKSDIGEWTLTSLSHEDVGTGEQPPSVYDHWIADISVTAESSGLQHLHLDGSHPSPFVVAQSEYSVTLESVISRNIARVAIHKK